MRVLEDTNCKTRYPSEFSDYIQINCIMSREKVFNLIFFPNYFAERLVDATPKEMMMVRLTEHEFKAINV